MKVCFVVHRYAPFPGGSEYYVQQMAEECARRGHQVTVVAGEHCGDLNGVRVTSQAEGLYNNDLIIVHGGDVGVQNMVLSNAKMLSSPILYLLIKPSDSDICVKAMYDVKYIGCSTPEDWQHVNKYGVEYKANPIIHGISPIDCLGVSGVFKKKYNIPEGKRMFLSCGGYWPNKRMIELAETFKKANLSNSVLVTTGYDNRHNIMPHASENVIPLMVDDPKDVKNAICDADAYIMNSDSEGFGLVILEAMLNKTPWISRDIAAASMLRHYGQTYDNQDQLIYILQNFQRNETSVESGYSCVIENFLIKNTVDHIERILSAENGRKQNT